MAKSVLAVGAYERDNFGDILFFETLRANVPTKTQLTAGSILPRPSTDYFPYEVVEYHRAAKDAHYDVIWVVGGEVGGVNIDNGYSMSLRRDIASSYADTSLDNREYLAKALIGESDRQGSLLSLPAYFPDRLSVDTKLIIHSVGLGALSKINSKTKMIIEERLLDAENVVVRDKVSYVYCEDRSIATRLSPDVVHTIKHWYKPKDVNKQYGNYLIFQASEQTLVNFKINKLAEILQRTAKQHGLSVLFFSAGLAPGHDSYEKYTEIARYLQQKYKIKTFLPTERNAFMLVDIIANASLWIGSSLHGRVVSNAYSIPRVSLRNTKVNNYVKTWDADHPYDATEDNLAESIRLAMEYSGDDSGENNAHLAGIELKSAIRKAGL